MLSDFIIFLYILNLFQNQFIHKSPTRLTQKSLKNLYNLLFVSIFSYKLEFVHRSRTIDPMSEMNNFHHNFILVISTREERKNDEKIVNCVRMCVSMYFLNKRVCIYVICVYLRFVYP